MSRFISLLFVLLSIGGFMPCTALSVQAQEIAVASPDTAVASAVPVPHQTQALAERTTLPAATPLPATASASLLEPVAEPVVQETPDPLEEGGGAPVLVSGRTLFYIYAPSAIYSAQERADIVAQRINPLLSKIEEKKIRIRYENNVAVLMRGNLALMTVTPQDAQAAQIALPQLAEYYAQQLSEGISRAQIKHNVGTLILDGVLALLFTLLLGVIIFLMGRFLPLLHRYLNRLRTRFLTEIRFHNAVLLSTQQLSDGLLACLQLVRNVSILILLYFYLPLVLSLFPWTRSYSSTLLNYVTVPLFKAVKAFANYIPSLFIIVLIGVGTYYLLKLVKLIFTGLDQGVFSYPGFEQEWAKPTYSIVRFLILAFAAIVIFPYLPGSESPAFKSVSLFLGILFSLGSSSAIANIVAGVVLTYMNPFRVGDRVKISDTMGDVIEKNLLVTRIRTPKNVRITVPNSMVLTSHIVNYSTSARTEGLILHTTVTLGYDVPWQKVHETLLEAARRTPNVLQDASHQPFVLQTSLDDFYVAYELNVLTHHPGMMAKTYSLLHQNIQDTCNENGIEILSPHFSAVRDGSALNQPPEYIPKDYEAPGFKIFPWKL